MKLHTHGPGWRTPADEQSRYAAVNAQITQLLDEAVNDTSPAMAILRALLMAEMYERNEKTHTRALAEQEQASTCEEK